MRWASCFGQHGQQKILITPGEWEDSNPCADALEHLQRQRHVGIGTLNFLG